VDLQRTLKRDFGDSVLDAWMDFNQDDDPVPCMLRSEA